MDQMIDVEFTPDVKAFLVGRGYTYILYKGMDDAEANPESKKDNQWLKPLKEGDARINDNEPGYVTVKIDDEKVKMMSDGKSKIQFMISVPVEDHIVFLKDR